MCDKKAPHILELDVSCLGIIHEDSSIIYPVQRYL